MGNRLPEIAFDTFRRRVRELSPIELPESAYVALHLHYGELRRWNLRSSLIGPGTAADVLDRHYGESLAALPLIRSEDRSVVDLGSGAGFPGWVIAAALPDAEVTLVEPRQKKWAFLRTACRRSGLSCRCLDARVGHSLPEGLPVKVDVVTCRAVAVTPEILEAFFKRSQHVRFLLWLGQDSPPLLPELECGQELPIVRSEHRRILEVRPRILS